MKIAIIIPTYQPSLGGLERLSHLLAKGLVRFGIDVTVLTIDRFGIGDEYHGAEKIIRYNTTFGLGYIKLVKDMIRTRFCAYYLMSYIPTLFLILPMLLAKLQGIPVIYQPVYQPQSFLLQRRKSGRTSAIWQYILAPNLLVKRADYVIALTHFEAEFYRSLGIPQSRLSIIHEFVEPREIAVPSFEEMTALLRRYSIERHKAIILAVGRVVWNKGFDLLARAIPSLLSSFSHDFLVVVVGPWTPELLSIKEILGQDSENHMVFVGAATDRELASWYSVSSVVVCPSRYEAFFRIPLEAWAYKKPIICTDIPVAREIVEPRVNGLLFKLGDHSDLAEGIRLVLTDSTLREKIAHGGYATFMCHTTETIIPQIKSVLRSATGHRFRKNNRIARAIQT